MEPTVWQISGGPVSRSYADRFLEHGVGLIGPGDPGRWMPERSEEEYDGPSVRQFAEEVGIGDVLLLRTGISTIRAVGLVASEYLYLTQFDEVHGWALQHARRVRWCPLPTDYDFGEKVFGANPRRITRVQQAGVIEYAGRFLNSPPTGWQTAALPSLPADEPPLHDIPERLRDIVGRVQDRAAYVGDGSAFGDPPAEDELVAHFIVPFFRALGWADACIAVKWNRIDVALFKALPRTPNNCHLVIEAKRAGAGVEGALDQARGYVQALGVPRDIVVTDGLRYRMYAAQDDFRPVAYASLARLKQSATELFARLGWP